MNKFKVGDKVRRTASSETLKVGDIYEVEAVYMSNDAVSVRGCRKVFDATCFELVTDNERIRKSITDAITTLAYYDVWRGTTGFVNNSSSVVGLCLSEYLDKHYPLKTPQQLEIESIRKEQEKLAARLKELEV